MKTLMRNNETIEGFVWASITGCFMKLANIC